MYVQAAAAGLLLFVTREMEAYRFYSVARQLVVKHMCGCACLDSCGRDTRASSADDALEERRLRATCLESRPGDARAPSTCHVSRLLNAKALKGS
jgi:hypothetical protein